ncbi:MAG TPA: sugar ABC transporter ATP-binding protein [Tepidisphaeraceae bacterium]|jgi:rhamnose transport system ATP-binding protein
MPRHPATPIDAVPLMRLRGVTKSFGGVRALRGIDFDLRAGEVHALLGENGAGKSTLIKIITGAHAPDAGTIELAGQRLGAVTPSLARMLGIAAVYQQPTMFPDLTVAENIALRLETGGAVRIVRWTTRRARAAELLARVGARIDVDTPVRRLSLPQQQLVEIAGAVGGEARVLILDEPTVSLGERDVAHLFDVVRQLRDNGVGIIYISHRLEELPRIADRVTVLRDGAYVATRPAAEIDRAEMIRLMVGRSLESIYPKTNATLGEVVLETRGLSCRATGTRGVSLGVRAGEILGLAGLVGAGRTELAGTLFGLTPADGGQILLRGNPITVTSPADAVRQGIAYLPEDRRRHGVVLDMSVAENSTLAVLGKIARGSLIDFGREARLAQSFVERLGTKTPDVHAAVGTLSGGNQQKVALARWLATEPSVILLDEPTQGVDVGAKAEIHKLIGELARRGIAIVLISSELPELLGMSDRIAVMHEGAIAGVLDRAWATQEAILDLALGAEPAKGAA